MNLFIGREYFWGGGGCYVEMVEEARSLLGFRRLGFTNVRPYWNPGNESSLRIFRLFFWTRFSE